MKQNSFGIPSAEQMEGMEVVALLELRLKIRQQRDARRAATNESITAAQAEIHREAMLKRRVFDLTLNDLKRQMDELIAKDNGPENRVKVADLREKISELKYDFTAGTLERDHKLQTLANERQKRNAQNQTDYEWAEMEICKVIRAKGGFKEYGFGTDNNGQAQTHED